MAQPEEIALAPVPEAAPSRRLYVAYSGEVSSWFTGWGMQQVLFMGLVTLVLGMPAECGDCPAASSRAV